MKPIELKKEFETESKICGHIKNNLTKRFKIFGAFFSAIYIIQMKDYIIVGFGFAGIAFTHMLEKNKKQFLVFDANISKSTITAAALFNPVILKRFTAAWKATEQMQLLRTFYKEMEARLGEKIMEELPTFRKFASLEEQNNWFIASDELSLSEYLLARVEREINPNVSAKFGFGRVLHTGRIDTRKMVNRYTQLLERKHLIRREKFDFSALEIKKDSVCYKGISARRIVFCEGYNVVENPYFNYLPMQGCKGELLTFLAPKLQLNSVVKSGGFIIPFGENNYKIGTTYVLDDKTNTPTESAKAELLEKLKDLISCDFEITGQEVGIRPTILDRRPLLGTHPEHKPLCILNGLGTRGAMLAPYTAVALFSHLENSQELDKEMNINRFQKRFYKKEQ